MVEQDGRMRSSVMRSDRCKLGRAARSMRAVVGWYRTGEWDLGNVDPNQAGTSELGDAERMAQATRVSRPCVHSVRATRQGMIPEGCRKEFVRRRVGHVRRSIVKSELVGQQHDLHVLLPRG